MVEMLESRKLLSAAPVISLIETTHLAYTEGTTVPLTNLLTVSDSDSTTMAKATEQITGKYQKGEDFLTFANTGTITGVFDAATGTMTLTGTDTLANYQTAMRSVMYHTGQNPNANPRTVSFIVNDGTNNSNTGTRTVDVTPVNNAPVVSSIETTPLSYTEGQTKIITGSIVVTDPDNTNLASAKVTISGNYQNGQDILAFTDTAKIKGSFDATTGTLTLTGSDTVGDYVAALRSVTYNDKSQAPSTSPRTISITANDGAVDSNAQTRTINVTAVNNPPVISLVETTPLEVTVGQAAAVVSANILVTDPDDDNLAGATVTISLNYHNGQDVLAFVNTSKITGNFDAATGKLTLSGSDTVSDYYLALRTVTYQNTSATPNTSKRIISFQANDGHATSHLSNVATRNVFISPILSGVETTALDFAANNASTSRTALAVSPTIALSDAAGNMISGATVQITGNYQTGQDVLTFTNASGITGTFDAPTGKLTLTGSATAAAYQTALRSVKYQNNSASITNQTRTVTFNVTDSSTAKSNSVTRDITVHTSTVVAGIETTALAYTVGNAATPVTSTITVTDPKGTTIAGATVKITNFQTGDTLGFKDTSKIKGTYDSTTGTLTLAGSDTVANYQAALRAVTFQNTTNSSNTSRTVSFQVGTTLPTTAVTRNITVTQVFNAPVISGAEARRLKHHHHRHHGGEPSVVQPNLTLSVVGSTTLTGATVTINNYHSGKDTLAFTKVGTITGTFDSTTGILTLTGSDTVANYQAALRSVTFDTSARHGTRDISMVVSNGSTNSFVIDRKVRIRR